MAVLSLPLSFNNSFWSQDYRKGLEVLFHKLEQGVAENDEIIVFVRARAVAESQLANALSNMVHTGTPGTGFQADDGASLLMTFRGLKAESASQGQIHRSIAKELETLVADPFAEWAQGYKDRLRQSKGVVFDQWLKGFEQSQAEVAKLKQQYLAKTRKADEAEDDVRFAPNSAGVAADHYTTSPRMRPVDGRSPPQRTASVSERIAQRLKEIQMRSVGAFSGDSVTSGTPDTAEKLFEADPEKELPKVDKGKGKAVDERPISPAMLASPTPMSPMLPPKVDIPPVPANPEDIVLAGVALPRSAVSQLITRAASEMNLRPVRFPLLGEYQDCFNGEEFVVWLKDNVPAFEGSLDRAEDAAKYLTEKEGLLRRIGEFGNEFEDADDAFYQFRPKAFNFDGKSGSVDALGSPIKTTLQPQNILKSTNNFVNLVSKALATNPNGQPAFIRARQDAEEADKAYRIAVRQLDRRRLNLEERLEESFKTLQRWETERLRAVKTVLLQYQGTLANLPKSLESSIERQSTLITAYQPEADLSALIERYRTGPFRPHPHVYESVAHDESDVLFGVDLRKWAEVGYMSQPSDDKKEAVPEVLSALLRALERAYARLPNDTEKRKSWIYEVPLVNVHYVRETLNAVQPDQPIPPELLEPYDAPALAAAIKLWLLELEPPLAMYEGWDEFRKLYPSMGAALIAQPEGEDAHEMKIKDLGAALQKLPRVHLYVLDVVVSHLRKLIQSTKVDEPDEVYIAKVALSVGRTLLRPKVETELSIQDRHPTLLFIDLIQDYDALIPPTITRKKRESERKIPIRKRTAPIDMRLSRSRISVSGVDAKQLLAAQQAAQHGVKPPEKDVPPVPPLPSSIHSPTPVPPPPPPIELASPKSISPPPLPPAVERPPTAPAQDSDLPPRPMFKEPPPEDDDDLPPRPSFKTPPPEPEDPSTPPRPNFAEPPPEESDSPSTTIKSRSASPPSGPATAVIPPTPENRSKRASISSRSESPAPTSPSLDEALNPGRASISRSSSGGVRGPRLARGPRAPGTGNVASMVSNLNRNSVSSPGSSSPTSPSYKRLSGGGSPRRPSSVLGKSSFSRRTMASDAEDDVVDRK